MHRNVALAFSMILPVAAAAAAASPRVPPLISAAHLQGRYDNVAKALSAAVPRVTVAIEATPRPDFALWRVRVETDPQTSFEQTWALQSRVEHDGSGALIPYYQLHQDAAPEAAAFEPGQWLSLEACALRGRLAATRFEGFAEGEPCVAVSMSIGARRALLPVGVRVDGNALAVDLNLRGERTHVDLRRAEPMTK